MEELSVVNKNLDSKSSSQTLDATSLYLKEIGYSPLLSAEEEVSYSIRLRQGDNTARRKMIESNLRLVVKIARCYINRGLDLLDLVEEGNLGLMRAVRNLIRIGLRFSTYATWWIRQTIERALMNQTRTIRLPVHVVKELNTYKRAARKLAQNLDHMPNSEDVAKLVDKPVETVSKMLELNDRICSLDVSVGESDKSLKDTIPDYQTNSPERLVSDDNLSGKLALWINELPEKQKEVLIRRFGLMDHQQETLDQVGREVGLTSERVRQINIDGLKRLRSIIKQNGLSRELMFSDIDEDYL